MVVDLVGIHPALANALRRIMMAEIPTIAIETVYIENNTSVIPDEVLSHRLGLIPINVNPDFFEYKGESPTDVDTLVFTLAVQADPHQARTVVYSRDLIWDPKGNQEEILVPAPAPIHPDIMIAKLAPDQEIRLTCHAHKGIGKDHMKFSPVSPATYRNLPEILLKRPFRHEEAAKLRQTCPMGVFDIEDIGGVPTAYVANPRNCSLCRECIRDVAWRNAVSINRVKDHFIFTIETVGVISPVDIFRKALVVLSNKADIILSELAEDAALTDDPLR
jgi:DNA-directed RNA polymerase I and III subunit RPAC1